MNFETLQVHVDPPVCHIRLHRPQADNRIDQAMVDECQQVLRAHEGSVHVVVLEGLPQVFCLGADFREYAADAEPQGVDPAALYDLWNHLAHGPFVSIAHVRGKATAGGVGFAAACDIVLSDRSAEFSLPELLFGLFPACVMPFLARRIGWQRAHYMTLGTRPVSSAQALEWGLVDACAEDSADLLRKHLLRLRHLSKVGIQRYKTYAHGLDTTLAPSRSTAVAANRALFSDPDIRATLRRFAQTGQFPWES